MTEEKIIHSSLHSPKSSGKRDSTVGKGDAQCNGLYVHASHAVFVQFMTLIPQIFKQVISKSLSWGLGLRLPRIYCYEQFEI